MTDGMYSKIVWKEHWKIDLEYAFFEDLAYEALWREAEVFLALVETLCWKLGEFS